MPLPLPDLDTLNYSDLTTQAQNRIQQVFPAWTNYNPSDPGIMLLELLAWLVEILGYRTDQVTDKNVQTFLRLLNPPGWVPPDPNDPAALQAAIRATLGNLHVPYRAVTAEDYAFLIFDRWAGTVARVQCVALRDLEGSTPDTPAPAHLSVVLVPQDTTTARPTPSPELCTSVRIFLEERRQLTTRLHVVGPRYVPITLTATLYLREGMTADAALTQASADLARYFQPLASAGRAGWPFGQDVHLSDMCALLSAILVNGMRAVDYVYTDTQNVPSGLQRLTITTSDNLAQRQQLSEAGVVAIALKPYELAALDNFKLVAVETNGNRTAATLTSKGQLKLTQIKTT